MFAKLECIALRTVRYNDKKSILSVYSRQYGRLTFAVPAGGGRTAARLRALLMPLGRFECVTELRPGHEILSMRDVRPVGFPPCDTPVKATLGLFVAELLSSLLREPQEDEALFRFLADASERLAEMPGSSPALANFHIGFMMRLQRFLGIEPDWSTYAPGKVFDMAGGIFLISPPLHGRYLAAKEAEAANALNRMTFRNCGRFRLSRADRNTIIDRLLAYYKIHFPSSGQLKGLDVLRSMYDF